MRIYPSERRSRRYVEQDDEEGSQGVVVPGPRAKRRRVTVQRAPPIRSRVCARVAKRAPRLSSLCKEAIQITPHLLLRAPSSQARINAIELRIDPQDHPSDRRSTANVSVV